MVVYLPEVYYINPSFPESKTWILRVFAILQNPSKIAKSKENRNIPYLTKLKTKAEPLRANKNSTRPIQKYQTRCVPLITELHTRSNISPRLKIRTYRSITTNLTNATKSRSASCQEDRVLSREILFGVFICLAQNAAVVGACDVEKADIKAYARTYIAASMELGDERNASSLVFLNRPCGVLIRP